MKPPHGAIALLLLRALLASAAGAQASAPPAGASLRGLSVAPDGTIWASGTGGTVLRSRDGGRSWAARSIPDAAALDLRDVEAVSATTAYAMVAGADTARIYRTTDGGRHWARQYDDTRKGVFLDGIAFWDGSRGIALGDPMDGRFLILRTEDGGAHWTELTAEAAPAALPGEAAFAASGTAVVAGPAGRAWIGTGGGAAARVFRSSDYGRTWVASDTPIPGSPSAGIFSLAFRDTLNGIAVGGDYAHPRAARPNVAVTADGGRTWVASDTPIPAGSPSAGIFSLAFRDTLQGVAVGGDYAHPRAARPNVAVTADGGRTWALGDSTEATAYLSAVAYLPGGRRVVAVGTEGTFESADGGRTWVRSDTVSCNAVAALPRSDSVVAVGERGRVVVRRAIAAGSSPR